MYVRRKLLQAYIFGMITFQVHRQLYRECNGDYAQVAAMPLPRIDLSEGAEIEWHELAHWNTSHKTMPKLDWLITIDINRLYSIVIIFSHSMTIRYNPGLIHDEMDYIIQN